MGRGQGQLQQLRHQEEGRIGACCQVQQINLRLICSCDPCQDPSKHSGSLVSIFSGSNPCSCVSDLSQPSRWSSASPTAGGCPTTQRATRGRWSGPLVASWCSST